MLDKKLIHTLIKIGLNEKEAEIYLSSLALGPSTVAKISQSSQIKRTTVYSVIESLKEKGLMSIQLKGFKQFYVAEKPDKLADFLEERKKTLKNALPQFESLYQMKGIESVIKHYEGLNNIKSLYNSVLADLKFKDDYLTISDTKRWLAQDEEFFNDFIKKRAKHRARVRLLLQDNEVAQNFKQFQRNYGIEVKILPMDTELNTNLLVVPKQLIIQQLTIPYEAVAIENQNIINMGKQLFEIIWSTCK
ncbi:MAG TPA: helix-turn-helix domain-containing protein [bacterium]|nr:helix-turn-helix domain-containing protein [bacterium]